MPCLALPGMIVPALPTEVAISPYSRLLSTTSAFEGRSTPKHPSTSTEAKLIPHQLPPWEAPAVTSASAQNFRASISRVGLPLEVTYRAHPAFPRPSSSRPRLDARGKLVADRASSWFAL